MVMKAKEKLERAGWQFAGRLDYRYEIYRRGCLRIIFDHYSNEAVAVYNLFKSDFRLIDDIMFDFLTEKIEAE
jgi:hypothetical protein